MDGGGGGGQAYVMSDKAKQEMGGGISVRSNVGMNTGRGQEAGTIGRELVIQCSL